MVRLLLAEGADPAVTDNSGRGAADYMTVQTTFIEARIDDRQQSRAWRPTADLDFRLFDLSGKHADIRVLLGIEPATP